MTQQDRLNELKQALEARLAKEIVFPKESLEEIAVRIGMDLAVVRALPPLSTEDEAAVAHVVWAPVAQSCVVRFLHAIFDEAEYEVVASGVRYTDEDLATLAIAKIAAPRHQWSGLPDSATRRKAADLTTELFCDRSRFTEPTPFTVDGKQFTLHRDGDVLVVQYVKP